MFVFSSELIYIIERSVVFCVELLHSVKMVFIAFVGGVDMEGELNGIGYRGIGFSGFCEVMYIASCCWLKL